MDGDYDNTKRKVEPVGTIRHYWNRASFARSFEIITNRSPQECARLIAELQRVPSGSSSWQLTVDVQARSRHLYDYKCEVERETFVYYLATVVLKGVIVFDRGLEQTAVRGDVRLSWLYAIVMGVRYGFACIVIALVLAVSSQDSGVSPLLCLSLLIGLFVVGFLIAVSREIGIMSTDYDRLVKRIHAAVG